MSRYHRAEEIVSCRIGFAEFRRRCVVKFLSARECDNDHWQVVGGERLVNFYPSVGTTYVQGAKRGVRGKTAEEAIAMAGRPVAPLVVESAADRSTFEPVHFLDEVPA